MVLASLIGGSLAGAIAGFFKGKMNTNEIVVTMMLNFIAFWLVSFMIKEGVTVLPKQKLFGVV